MTVPRGIGWRVFIQPKWNRECLKMNLVKTIYSQTKVKSVADLMKCEVKRMERDLSLSG